jgi:hypothetical protein
LLSHQTVLRIVARQGSQGLLRLLLECGAARYGRLRDTPGDTPLDIGLRNKQSRRWRSCGGWRAASAAAPEAAARAKQTRTWQGRTVAPAY